MRRLASLVFALASLASTSADGEGLAEVKARYTKYEYRIPMRDGKRLFTAVYVPKDPTAGPIRSC